MRVRPLRIVIVMAALLALLLPGMLVAQEGERTGGWEVSGYIGAFDDSPEFDPDGGAILVDPAGNALFGGRLGYTFPVGFFIEAEAGYIPLDLSDPPTVGPFGNPTGARPERDLDLLLYGGSLGYTLRLHPRFDLFGLVGGGAARWEPAGLVSETDLRLHYGAGIRLHLAPWLALRGDARLHHVPDALGGTGRRVGISTGAEETFWGWEFSGGLSLLLGGPRDGDGDGVTDDVDACPDTPRGVSVNARGCPVDTDGDGVADHVDECAGTPMGARVDAAGCAVDGDGDGVADGLDRCPETPMGATVDRRGCAGDSDGDGVVNGVDECAGTPMGARVDAAGCPMDGDDDGVLDGLDECPNTAPGSEVDEDGCPVSEVQRELEEEGRLTLEGSVHFGFDSAELRSEAFPILDEVGSTLEGHPGVRVEIRGYTDSVGPESYNRQLSLRRAQSVRDYLVENFAGLEMGQFEVRGLGESNPVASNDTEDGRSRNRRVELVVVEQP